MKKLIIGVTLIATCLYSCTKDSPDTPPPFTGYTYVPGNVGHELIYDVDSIAKSDFTLSTDTFHYQIKEVIESIYDDNQGRPTMRLERYKRNTSSDPWVIYKVWSANLTVTTYEKKEDNITYIKLIFPTKLNTQWNGNTENTLEEKLYEITSLNEAETSNSLSFDSTLTVTQSDFDDNILTKDYEVEKFATGVGMYYREYYVGEYNTPQPPGIPFSKFVLYTEKLISYSN